MVFVGSYLSIGAFVIQPIGAVPEGATIIYFRMGLNIDFISSADGILLEREQQVSLLNRAVVLAQMGKIITERKMFSLPYVEELYLISTRGKKYNR